jgi:hypothetical protein
MVENSFLDFLLLPRNVSKGRRNTALVENGITYLVSSGKAIKNTKVGR